MRHGSLFSGIGGFDLAATWMGWENLFQCEKDTFCQKVLKYYWPQPDFYEDIRQFDAAKYSGLVDIISGGFPCQPFSHAGRRRGAADDRYLWPQALRVIRQARPRWVVLENVTGLFTVLEPKSLSQVEIQALELYSAGGQEEAGKTVIRLQRRILGTIIHDIQSAGYTLPAFTDGTPIILCIPACAVNAPHRRDRIWIVAHAQHDAGGQAENKRQNEEASRETTEKADFHQGCLDQALHHPAADTDNHRDGQHGRDRQNAVFAGQAREHAFHDSFEAGHDLAGPGKGRIVPGRFDIPGWDGWPTQSPVCGRNDGVPGGLDGITFPKWCSEGIRGFGNAIVPQVALELFRVIEEIEQQGF